MSLKGSLKYSVRLSQIGCRRVSVLQNRQTLRSRVHPGDTLCDSHTSMNFHNRLEMDYYTPHDIDPETSQWKLAVISLDCVCEGKEGSNRTSNLQDLVRASSFNAARVARNLADFIATYQATHNNLHSTHIFHSGLQNASYFVTTISNNSKLPFIYDDGLSRLGKDGDGR